MLHGVSQIYSDNNIMCAKCGSVKLTALLSVAANFVLVACEDQSSSKPTVAMSVIYLAIPVMIGVTAMTLLTRKLYIACAKKFQPEEDVAIREFAEEFSTSLDTTDSFDQVKLKNNEEEHIIVPWNPFHKRYANVETKNDLDPLEEMEARFVERKMIKVSHPSVRPTLMLQKCNTAISPFLLSQPYQIIPTTTAPTTPSTPSSELLWSPKPQHDFSRLHQGTYARSPQLISTNLGVSIRV